MGNSLFLFVPDIVPDVLYQTSCCTRHPVPDVLYHTDFWPSTRCPVPDVLYQYQTSSNHCSKTKAASSATCQRCRGRDEKCCQSLYSPTLTMKQKVKNRKHLLSTSSLILFCILQKRHICLLKQFCLLLLAFSVSCYWVSSYGVQDACLRNRALLPGSGSFQQLASQLRFDCFLVRFLLWHWEGCSNQNNKKWNQLIKEAVINQQKLQGQWHSNGICDDYGCRNSSGIDKTASAATAI